MSKKTELIDTISAEELTELYAAYDQKKLKKVFKKEGRKIKSLPPLDRVSPYIMVERNEASNMFCDKLNMERIDEYIKQKQKEGYPDFSLMHVLVAAYIRTVSQRPGINRFIRGQRPWARKHVEVCLTIKKEMSRNSPETVIKAFFRPDATALDVYKEFDAIVKSYRNAPGGDFDNAAKFFHLIPGVLLKFVLFIIKMFDYFGWLARFLTWLSPFHGSMFITSMGSLGIPPIYHHLYNFGNVPIFISFGAKYRKNELEEDGTVKKHTYVDYTVVMDERICDGFYYASAFRYMKGLFRNPWALDERPESIAEDIK